MGHGSDRQRALHIDGVSRRSLLAATGATAGAGVAGCAQRDETGSTTQTEDATETAQQSPPSDAPNVILIEADGWRGDDIGYMDNEQVQTPTLDRLASEGMIFENAYSNHPVCSPAKAALRTGTFTHENDVIMNSYNDIALSQDATSIADAMGAAGYRTGFIGKWHLDGQQSEHAYVPPERRQGFEWWRGFERGHAHTKGHPVFDDDGEMSWIEGYQPTVQTDMALEFIEQGGETPFLLYSCWGPPHKPRQAPQEYHQLYDAGDIELRPNVPDANAAATREKIADYYASMTALDDQVARIIEALEAQGIAEDTLFVFTSDHGNFIDSHGRGGKGSPLEESAHVPLIFHHPSTISSGQRSTAPVGLTDVMPTVLSHAGISIPAPVQGRDLSHLLAGADGPTPTSVYLENPSYIGRIPRSPWRAIRTERYLLEIIPGLGNEVTRLYDLQEDPYQQTNLADQDDPDAPVQELKAQLVDKAVETDDHHIKANAKFRGRENAVEFRFNGINGANITRTETELDALGAVRPGL
jgi:arylsulfatase A-like enzyme